MIDVFVRRWVPVDPKRQAMRSAMFVLALVRWGMQADANVQHVVEVHGDPQFHMRAKRWAEEHATSDVYVVADDDCLILGKQFVSRGVKTLLQHADYGLLAAASVIEDGDLVYSSSVSFTRPHVVERHAVGGVAFVRRGILKRFDACPANLTDETICNEITGAGYKVGVMPGVKFNHLGYGFAADGPYWEA